MSAMRGVMEKVMSSEIHCGSVKSLSLRFIAERAAGAVMSFHSPRAVSVDPQGRVTVEGPRSACEYDLVGVYSQAAGHDALVVVLQEEFAAELARRQWRNKVEERRQMKPTKKAA